MEIFYWVLSGLFLFWGIKTLFPSRNAGTSLLQGGFAWDGLIIVIIFFFGGSAGFAYLALNA